VDLAGIARRSGGVSSSGEEERGDYGREEAAK
jgi:hypothetical protein